MIKQITVFCALCCFATAGASYAQTPPSMTEIRQVYIETMPNDLHQYISAEITKQLKGRLLVVLQKESADAILRGTSEQKSGVGAAITGRYLGLHDNATASVSLIDAAETVVLWSGEAGDRSMLFGTMSRGGQRKVAGRLVNNLKDVINKADKDSRRIVTRPAAPTPPIAKAATVAPQPSALSAPVETVAPGAATPITAPASSPAEETTPSAIPTLATTYRSAQNTTAIVNQDGESVSMHLVNANGPYGRLRLVWSAEARGFIGDGTLQMCGPGASWNPTVSAEVYVTADGSLRNRWTHPTRTDCGGQRVIESTWQEAIWKTAEGSVPSLVEIALMA